MDLRGDLVLYIQAFTRIWPLERPRKAPAGHMYQPLENQQGLWQELLSYRPYIPKPVGEAVVVDMTIYFERSGKTEYPVGKSYGDEDNLRKGVCDGLVKTSILSDDRWIIGGETWKLFGLEDMVEIKIYKAKRGTLT